MNLDRKPSRPAPGLAALPAVLALLAGCAAPQPPTARPADPAKPLASTARVDSSLTSRALQQLPPKPRAERLAVAIHRFRSGVPEVQGGAATDMFTAALVESHQFRVLERAQLRGGVIAEKQLNATGQTQGSTSQQALLDAQFIFEGNVSESNNDESVRQGGVSVGPVEASGSASRSSIVIDVRVVSVATGEVVDAITVRKPVYVRNASAGVGSVPGAAAAATPAGPADTATLAGRSVGAGVSVARRDGVGRALRACIEVAVLQLAQRTQLQDERPAAPNPTPAQESKS